MMKQKFLQHETRWNLYEHDSFVYFAFFAAAIAAL